MHQWEVPAVGFEGSFVGQNGEFGGEARGYVGGFADAGYTSGGGFDDFRHDGVNHDEYGVPHEDYGVPYEEYGPPPVPHDEYGPPALRVEPVTEQ